MPDDRDDDCWIAARDNVVLIIKAIVLVEVVMMMVILMTMRRRCLSIYTATDVGCSSATWGLGSRTNWRPAQHL